MGFIENMKWWHWVFISLVLGAVIGFVNSSGGDPDPVHASMSDQVFQQRLMMKTPEGKPWLTGIVVHPVRTIVAGDQTWQAQLVTFDSYIPAQPPQNKPSYEKCSLMARYPFEPVPRYRPNRTDYAYPGTTIYIAQPGDSIDSLATHFYGKQTPAARHAIIQANPNFRNAKSTADLVVRARGEYWIPWNPADKHNVSDFILAANKIIAQNPTQFAGKIGYTFTWWENPKYAYIFAMTGAFILLGVIWPIFLHFLVKAGYGSPRAPEEYDLNRFQHVEEPKPEPVVVPPGEMQKLRDLEEIMAANLKAGAQSATAAPAAVAAAPPEIKKLAANDGSPPPSSSPAPEAPREYMGEYYPVVKPVDQKSDSH